MNKYHAKRCSADGHAFDSMAERDRYLELVLLQKAKLIEQLEVHPRVALYAHAAGPTAVIVGYFEPDFVYHDRVSKRVVVEDVKGKDTTLSTWKMRHYHAQTGTVVTVVRMPARRKVA